VSLLEVSNIGVKYSKGKKNFGFSKGKGEFWVLKDVSFSIEKGDVLGVIGKNGAGKSTLMSLVSGIIDPDKGSVVRNYKHALLLSLQAGFMMYLSGRKNIYLSGLLLGYKYKELKEFEEKIVKFADIGEFIDEPVATYSSGMKARLGFSICLCMDPELILIDEVLGVGDKDFKQKSKEALTGKIKKTSAIIVSHNEETLLELCNKLLIINNGITEFFGEINEGIEYYKNH
jgi:lipopolysaccharide transport system ATP-binding protein